ncbi:MAG: class I SAM-dependent methyltransferase [Saprospiraceae bacterium]
MRFKFGKNWKSFSAKVDEGHINASIQKMKYFLDEKCQNSTFIDIGCGSGLHSLSAIRLGASEVHSFDYDLDSVKTTENIKKQFETKTNCWHIEQGDILDEKYFGKLGQFDIVYSWGVLHHTGSMWKAIENSISLVKFNGYFFIAIYNNQGWKSKFWWGIKYFYNILPAGLNTAYALLLGSFFQVLNILKYTIMLKPMVAIKPLLNYQKDRGMSYFHDIIDWYGGFPFEYASVGELNSFFKNHGFEAIKIEQALSLGCNEILYQKIR